MKKLLIFSLVLFIHTICNAQFGQIQIRNRGTIHHLKTVNNNLMVGIIGNHCSFPRGRIIALDSMGQLLWQYESTIFYDDIFIDDGEIIITGIEQDNIYYSFVIEKLDLNGEWLAGNYIEILNGMDVYPLYTPPSSAIRHPSENGFLFYSNNVVVTVDSALNILEYYSYDFGDEVSNWEQIRGPFQSQILTYNIGDTIAYLTDNLLLQSTDSVALPDAIKNAYLLNDLGYILHLEDNTLHQIIDGELVSVDLPFADGLSFRAWENTVKDHLFVNIRDTKTLWEWDGHDSWQPRFWPEDERMSIWGGEYRQNTDQFWFSGSLTPFTLTEAAFVYSTTPTTEETLDIAITNIEQQQIDVELYYQHGDNYFFRFNYNFKITVKNFSNFPIQRFSLKGNTSMGNDCLNASLSFLTNDLSILPGEERSFEIETSRETSFVEENIPENYTREICFHAFAPDGKFDSSLDNNYSCITTNAIITGTKELRKNTDISLSPNPNNGQFKIISSDNIRSWTIYNAMGQTVKQAHNLSGINHELNLGNISKGIYFIAIELKYGTGSIERFIVE